MEAYHILIVEDDKEILDGVGIYMKNQGYEVFKAQNGQEGLKILEKEEIHLAIIDIMMPVMDGITMTMKLREHYVQGADKSISSACIPFSFHSRNNNIHRISACPLHI